MRSLSVVPKSDMIRSIVCHAFGGLEGFLAQQVRRQQKHVNVYAGSGVRGDGNFEIARRIQHPAGAEPFTVLLAWLTTDGSVYQPATPAVREGIDTLLLDLEPVVDRSQADRLSAGLSFASSAWVFHSTDSFGKHRLALRSFYRRKYVAAGASAQRPTPRGDAVSGVVDEMELTRITGEPAHDLLAFRRCVSTAASDARDVMHDHVDALARLSAPLRIQAADGLDSAPQPLAEVCHELLRAGVQELARTFKRRVAADEAGMGALRVFTQQPGVARASTWKELFGSYPPRGVVARIARRAGIQLPDSMGFYNFTSPHAMRQEFRRIRRWYTRCRRLPALAPWDLAQPT